MLAAIAFRDLILDEDQASSEQQGARVVDFSVDSELIGQELPVSVVIPPSAREGAREGERSLLVFLHGRGEDESSYLYDEMFTALTLRGRRAPVVAFPRGGPDSYWHDRESGAWGSYVGEELVPELVRRFDIEPEQVALGGISMGGFGAIDLARRGPIELAGGKRTELCAVGAHSPAIWEQASQTAPGAFDDEADFAAHDVLEGVGPPASPLAGKEVRVDVGDSDPFAGAAAKLVERLRAGDARARLVEGDGGHEDSYWRSSWRSYMRFYARALKRCEKRAERGRSSGEEETDSG